MKPKIIIWGYKLYDHSHSFIHNGFFRSFSWLGYDTYWFDDKDDVSTFDFTNSIFLTEGIASKGMPLREDCSYVLHNCPRFDGIGKRINIQYMTYLSYQFEMVAPGITVQDDCLFFPWGSPLLPHEFDEQLLQSKRGDNVYFLGTVDGPAGDGNYNQVSQFASACVQNGHWFVAGGGYTGNTGNKDIRYLSGWVSEEDQINMLSKAYMAPALQGERQLANGMIPCRAFKAISYGNDIITNNSLVDQFFNGETVYNPDCKQLFYDAKERAGETERKRWLFNEVRTKHTYIERCKAILKLL